MTRRSKVWLVVAVLFTILNLAGAVIAVAAREPLHAGAHLGLMLLGAFFVWRLAPGRYARRLWPVGRSSAIPRQLTDRLTNLEQSVDAVAIEVERIGEGQRFMTRLFTERGTPQAPGAGAAEPVEIKTPEAPPPVRPD